MTDSALSKACSKCKEVKPLADFHRNKKAKDGRQSRCKICQQLEIASQRLKQKKQTADALPESKKEPRMGRQELHTSDIGIQQKPDIADGADEREPEVVRAEQVLDKEYFERLAFNEEPVTIRLEPTAEKNAPAVFPVWVNGRGGEVLMDRNGQFVTPDDAGGRWCVMTYFPVGQVLTTKRKYLEVIIRAKIDTVQTEVKEIDGDNPFNNIKRFTSSVHNFSIIKDWNPVKGEAWLRELRRRNM